MNWYPAQDNTDPMVLVPMHHELGAKLVLDNVMLPPAQGSQADPASTNFDAYGEQDLDAALNAIFNHQNVGPFICRQLIQRLVTSAPSRDYVYRVAQVFNDDGNGVRGNLQAVVQAILLDYEARSRAMISQPTYGKQREPILRATALARPFLAPLATGGSYSQNGDQFITVTTTNAHRLNTGDYVGLSFTDTSGQPAPTTQGYAVTVSNTNTFTVAADNLAVGTYVQTNNVLTVSIAGHGLSAGSLAYLTITSGGASNGVYQVSSVPDSGTFTVATGDSAARSGACILPEIMAGYAASTVNGTNILTLSTTGNHGLLVNDPVYITFAPGTAPSGQYVVVSVPDAQHFTILVPGFQSPPFNNGQMVCLLAPPRMVRSGTVGLQSTWQFGLTDGWLDQTPLESPTVFNFFYPDFKCPGTLAAAGLTTPEFQLTSDTTVVGQMNFLWGGIMWNWENVNGVSSFMFGGGSIMLDVGPWMTTNYTATASGVSSLVDALNTLLLAGQLSGGAKTAIVNYVSSTANFPYDTPPSSTQMRDRVQAVVHLLATSPDFTIQK
jgi:hypothetical protein